MIVEKPTKLVEILAFNLWAISEKDALGGDKDIDEMGIWRDPANKSIRNSYRKLADRLLTTLSEAGIRVNVQRPALTDAFITRLITQPAVTTYKPEDDK